MGGRSVSRFAADVFLSRRVRRGRKTVRNFSGRTFGAFPAQSACSSLGCATRKDGRVVSEVAACASGDVAWHMLVPITSCSGQPELELENARGSNATTRAETPVARCCFDIAAKRHRGDQRGRSRRILTKNNFGALERSQDGCGGCTGRLRAKEHR